MNRAEDTKYIGHLYGIFKDENYKEVWQKIGAGDATKKNQWRQIWKIVDIDRSNVKLICTIDKTFGGWAGKIMNISRTSFRRGFEI